MHMGLSLNGKGWGCWRQQTHRGRSPIRLIQALIGCSWPEAARLAGSASPSFASGNLLEAVVSAMGGIDAPRAPPPALRLPKPFRPMGRSSAPLFRSYLADRGYKRNEIEWLALEFDLYWALTGDWSYRLIIPVHDADGGLVTWTGRAINEGAQIRYKTLTADPEKAGDGPLAHGPITDYFLGLPHLIHGGEFLVIAEGPFDAMRLALFAEEFDAQATCLFGKACSPAQLDWLAQLRHKYSHIYLLLDPDAALDALGLANQMAPLGIRPIFLTGENDPGEMKAQEIRKLLGGLARRGRHG